MTLPFASAEFSNAIYVAFPTSPNSVFAHSIPHAYSVCRSSRLDYWDWIESDSTARQLGVNKFFQNFFCTYKSWEMGGAVQTAPGRFQKKLAECRLLAYDSP